LGRYGGKQFGGFAALHSGLRQRGAQSSRKKPRITLKNTSAARYLSKFIEHGGIPPAASAALPSLDLG
jgi:hypothetical protein